jgi:hypothetical protein
MLFAAIIVDETGCDYVVRLKRRGAEDWHVENIPEATVRQRTKTGNETRLTCSTRFFLDRAFKDKSDDGRLTTVKASQMANSLIQSLNLHSIYQSFSGDGKVMNWWAHGEEVWVDDDSMQRTRRWSSVHLASDRYFEGVQNVYIITGGGKMLRMMKHRQTAWSAHGWPWPRPQFSMHTPLCIAYSY